MQHMVDRRLSAKLYGLYLLSHPLPVFFHTVAVTIFALIASWPHFNWGVISLVVAAHLAMQLSIAALNDYCDRHLDALGEKHKPIPLGLVSPREALVYGFAMIVVMVLLLLPLPLFALIVSVVYLVLGQAYNMGLKSTPLSGIVFALAIPLVPLYAFLGVGHVVPVVVWLVPIGALLGVALNLANALPDIQEDAEHGARTLAVVFGTQGVYSACPLLIFVSALFIAVLSFIHIVPSHIQILLVTLALTCVLDVSLLLYFGSSSSASAKKRYFYVVVVTCLVLATGWLLGVLL